MFETRPSCDLVSMSSTRFRVLLNRWLIDLDLSVTTATPLVWTRKDSTW